jgi:hypothetical protein
VDDTGRRSGQTRQADLADRPGGAVDRPAPGWLRALVVGGITVDVVLVAGVLTFLLKSTVGDLVFRTPLLILVLIAGTAAVLWTITRPRDVDR